MPFALILNLTYLIITKYNKSYNEYYQYLKDERSKDFPKTSQNVNGRALLAPNPVHWLLNCASLCCVGGSIL